MVEKQVVTVPFWKMHGAGNDFIIVDDRSLFFPASNRDWLARIASRHTGVGCEGIILIQLSESADFRMRFINPDGTEVAMCANGARCIARLAFELGIAGSSMSIETGAGPVGAEIVDGGVRLGMTPPGDWRLNQRLSTEERDIPYSFVNTGVEHVVVNVADLGSGIDPISLGPSIRFHPDFAPGGTNANFMDVTGKNTLKVRTYERGVEAETAACGTGIVASALIAARAGKVAAPVEVTAASGCILAVDFRLTDDSAKDVSLLGPAEHAFRGELDSPA